MRNEQLGKALEKALGSKKKEKKGSNSSPMKDLAKRWGIKDEDMEDFTFTFKEAVRDSMKD